MKYIYIVDSCCTGADNEIIVFLLKSVDPAPSSENLHRKWERSSQVAEFCTCGLSVFFCNEIVNEVVNSGTDAKSESCLLVVKGRAYLRTYPLLINTSKQ